jgi:hypothetical protein
VKQRDSDTAPADAATDDESLEILEEFHVVNEFSAVRIRKIRTRAGERLEIHAPRPGHTIRLDALALEGLSWQPPETISQWLEHPFGPPAAE